MHAIMSFNILRSFLCPRPCLSADPASGERREGCSKYRAPGKKKEGKRRREQRRGPAAGTEGKGRCHRGMVQDATVTTVQHHNALRMSILQCFCPPASYANNACANDLPCTKELPLLTTAPFVGGAIQLFCVCTSNR